MTTIVRAPRSGQFEVIPHTLIRDSRISLRALGAAIRLLSNADGYKMTSDDLARERGEGRDATRTALRELEMAGYLRRQRRQNERGRWSTEVAIFDTPTTEDGFSGIGRPMPEKPTVGGPEAGESGAESRSTKIKPSNKTKQLQPCTKLSGDGIQQVVVGRFEDLHLPPQLASAQAASVKQILAKEGCPVSSQQDVLDETQGVIERGEVRSSPLRLLRGLARSAAAGAFVLDLGIQVRERRKREADQAVKRSGSKEKERVDPSVAQAHIAEIQQVLRGRTGA